MGIHERGVMGRVEVRVTPRSSRNQIVIEGNVIKVYVTAAPTDGEANKAVCALIAKKLGIAPSKVDVIGGLSSRNKVLQIEGLEPEVILQRLANSEKA